MTIVKYLSIHEDMRYMLPQSGAWGGCRFDLSRECRGYDWLVVYDELPRAEQLACPRDNTILILTEPASAKAYPDNYLRQFGVVVDMQKRGVNCHANIKRFPAIWGWGRRSFAPNGKAMTYEQMLNLPPPQKSKWLSVVCSKISATPAHFLRFMFCSRFARENPNADFWGRGIRPIEDKADALLPYHFNLAAENYREHDHWTEKLAEPYLAYCVPAYYGCANVGDYFPPDSMVTVDINDYDSAAARLNELNESEYKRRFDAVCEARHLLLTKYHPAAKIAEWIDNPGKRAAENNGVIRTFNECTHHSGLSARLSYRFKKRRHKEKVFLHSIRKKLAARKLRNTANWEKQIPVIPAQAGISADSQTARDSRLRGNDE